MTHYKEFKERLEDMGNGKYRLIVRPYERIRGDYFEMFENDGYVVTFMWGTDEGLEIWFTDQHQEFDDSKEGD